ncbi:hypothetical protein AKJ16_DCAP10708 [Drosera capensis]
MSSPIQISSSDDSILYSDGGDGEVVSSSAPSDFASSSKRILPGWAFPAGSDYGAEPSNRVPTKGRSSTDFELRHGTPSNLSYGADNLPSTSQILQNDNVSPSENNGRNGWAAVNDVSASFITSSNSNVFKDDF